MSMPSASALTSLVRSRRAMRHFTDSPVTDDAVDRLVESIRWAPSGYNLQPVRVILVRARERRTALRRACLGQAQVEEAPLVFVLCGDRDGWRQVLPHMLAQERSAGAMSDAYAAFLRRIVPLAFDRGPLGVLAPLKRLVEVLGRLVRPVPDFPACHGDAWLSRQVALAAMNLMLAAEADGLHSCPMEGFDPRRVRRVLGLPRGIRPVMIVPVGHGVTPVPPRTRLPVAMILHREHWAPVPRRHRADELGIQDSNLD